MGPYGFSPGRGPLCSCSGSWGRRLSSCCGGWDRKGSVVLVLQSLSAWILALWPSILRREGVVCVCMLMCVCLRAHFCACACVCVHMCACVCVPYLVLRGSGGPLPWSFFTRSSLLRRSTSRSFPREPLRWSAPEPSWRTTRTLWNHSPPDRDHPDPDYTDPDHPDPDYPDPDYPEPDPDYPEPDPATRPT